MACYSTLRKDQSKQTPGSTRYQEVVGDTTGAYSPAHFMQTEESISYFKNRREGIISSSFIFLPFMDLRISLRSPIRIIPWEKSIIKQSRDPLVCDPDRCTAQAQHN